MRISKDERERAVFRSRRMYQTDRASDLATAEDRGERRGIEIGKREGVEIGKREGVEIGKREGAQNSRLEIAQRMLRRGRPISEIVEDTGLSIEEIETLKNGLDD